MNSQPEVDAVIAVHTATRPIARAVASIIDHTTAHVRVNVVAHNIDSEIIRANLGDYAAHPRVRLLSLNDGIPSPAGPMNHGLDTATARFVTVMGSDDELAPGAIDSWLALQRETGATTVLTKILIKGRGNDPYPPTRRGRRQRALDPVKDRLAYRSAPLGLIDRERFSELRFTEGLPSGEDLAYSSTLWFTGDSIAYDLAGPPYIINDDAGDRVTVAPRDVSQDFAFLDAIEAAPWFGALNGRGLTALTVKILRIHFFDAVQARLRSADGLRTHRAELISVLDRLSLWAPGAFRFLSLADRRVIEALRSLDIDEARIERLMAARSNYRSLAAAIPKNPFRAFHAQAPLRTLSAGMIAMRTS